VQDWKPHPSLHVGRAGHDVATFAGRIVVAGGFGPDLQHPQVSRSTEARQADGSRAWHTLAPMRRRRSNLTAAGTESAVYAIGGVTLSGRIRASVERFEDGAWHDAPRLPARGPGPARRHSADRSSWRVASSRRAAPLRRRSSRLTRTWVVGGRPRRCAAPGTPCGWSPPLSTSTPSAGGQVTTSGLRRRAVRPPSTTRGRRSRRWNGPERFPERRR
jgi:hypothetical protein